MADSRIEIKISETLPSGGNEQLPQAECRPLEEARARQLLAGVESLPDSPLEEFPESHQVRLAEALPASAERLQVLQSEIRSSNAGNELEVVAVFSEGECDLATSVSVIFSKVMHQLGRAGAHEKPPVTLQPQPPGKWRWQDCSTLVFEADDGRLPLASDFTLTVAAGTTAVDGSVLAADCLRHFSTAAPKLLAHYPDKGGILDSTPQIGLIFNQRVRTAELLQKISVRADRQPVSCEFEVVPEEDWSDEIRSFFPWALR